MISETNKEYLLSKFNVDTNKYSKEELNKILDEIINILNNSIKTKLDNIKELKDKLVENI